MGIAAMKHGNTDLNERAAYDSVLTDIADYVCDYEVKSEEAFRTARYCLIDSLACAVLALQFPACARLLGPAYEGMTVRHGVRVPGTTHCVDPEKGAFDIGAMVRWLDYNDTWLAAEWGHPSDNLGTILSLADYLSRKAEAAGRMGMNMRDVLTYMVKAHEIQGCLALENAFNRVGLDHVVLVKVASTAIAAHMMGGTREQVAAALSHAFVDGQALRTYRHAPNTGPRKSWAAGDACSRAVRLARMVMAGEGGYPSVLSASKWGFYDVLFRGDSFRFQRPYGSYVMENVLFKISYPAEFHSQTAVECAVALHPLVTDKVGEIERIELTTQEPAIRIISKTGPLHNYADRDHCLQYIVATALLKGGLRAEDYEDAAAADPRIDALRAVMTVCEDARYTADYYDPDKRAIANAVQVFFRDGSATDKIEVAYPVGHRRRREEGFPLIEEKARACLRGHYDAGHADKILAMMSDQSYLEGMGVADFMAALA